MPRHLPPFAAIRAFEAAARHMSFKDAAGELCVTASAISHQIKTLEDCLGQPMFLRDANRLFLTGAGRAYLSELSGLLDGLDRASRRASVRRGVPALRVLATPAFAARWLVPRLDRCPLGDAIRISVSRGAPDTDFNRNEADVVLHWGDGPVPGVTVEPLLRSGRYPVAGSGLCRQPASPADLLDATLLRDEVADAWADWFYAAGVAVSGKALQGPRYAHCELALTAAECGLGVALGHDAIVRGALANGSLVRLFGVETRPVTIYSIAYPEGGFADHRIRRFRDWLFREAGAEGSSAPASVQAAE